ncbi:MAG: PHB depolymerase family esterase [Pseudomonadota bacterium]
MIRGPAAAVLALLAFVAGHATAAEAGAADVPVLDGERLSVSGISSGGYMAGQLHLAHSGAIRRVGIVAAGPYDCARGSMARALSLCANGDGLSAEPSLSRAAEHADAGRIDPLERLGAARVWLFHGELDNVVAAPVVAAARDFYRNWLPESSLRFVDDVRTVHGMPTLASGAPCGQMAEPWLNACGYDAAGAMFAHLLDGEPARGRGDGRLLRLGQSAHAGAGFDESAFLYVPKACTADADCGLHVALHGCRQGAEFVGAAFAADAGYNEWADAYRVAVLYPQIAASAVAPMNPLGCWDWWGYTGEDYATRDGAQVRALKQMIDELTAPPR